MNHYNPLVLAACGAIGLAGTGVASATGGGSTDERTFRAPVQRITVDARDGDVVLRPSSGPVKVRVRRDHTINTPSTSEKLSGGALTLKTTCPLGFVRCESDYRVEAPSGTQVTIRKDSGTVDAGGRIVEVDDAEPLTLTMP